MTVCGSSSGFTEVYSFFFLIAKFGVETKELDDGLEIYGKPLVELKKGSSIHCYDDHRVAMAFSVLGSVVEGTIIEERRCVEKTWPNWWDDLQNKVIDSELLPRKMVF